ncbi:cysteinyl-tRNA synthetase [Brevinema andersonii]|uniref:Cysteine--tRNA ligase n=1 Tax=Brevinema andersonii TaxID=34097 RepID=A0A1I1DHL0_BREAD|nr:cysteine--tRNA ligase [Brevinema andersonii]SFB72240.1 cysteinyl-tRNA synthetase [Brevinema andersonii]
MIPELYNSATRKIEPLPQKQTFNIYSCGPTVYDFAHIGNLRTFLFEDLLIRSLKFLGYSVNHVRNITDVDDKIIERGYQKKLECQKITDLFSKHFFEDLETLNFDQSSTTYLKATNYIPQTIVLIQQLINRGVAYDSEDGVYFQTKAFPKYGDFPGLDLKHIKTGASGSEEFLDKQNLDDFVLWKKHKPEDGEIFWESPWGKGRPGWHTECAAIATNTFPEGLDIHTGGIDLLFPHHTNEKAQYECLSNNTMAKIWLHTTHLLVDNKKMSKSSGTFYTLKDLLSKGFSARAVRFYLLTGAHYRTPLNFTLEGLAAAEQSLKRLDNFIHEFSAKDAPDPQLKIRFTTALMKDFNISAAMSEIFELVNDFFQRKNFPVQTISDLKEINNILGFLRFDNSETLTPEEKLLFDMRIEARDTKNWIESDRLRDELLNLGIEVRDSKEGTSWRRL